MIICNETCASYNNSPCKIENFCARTMAEHDQKIREEEKLKIITRLTEDIDDMTDPELQNIYRKILKKII